MKFKKKKIVQFLTLSLTVFFGYISGNKLKEWFFIERCLTAIQRSNPDQRNWGWKNLLTLDIESNFFDNNLDRINNLFFDMTNSCLQDTTLNLIEIQKFGWLYQTPEELILAANSVIETGHPLSYQMLNSLLKDAPLNANSDEIILLCKKFSQRGNSDVMHTITKLLLQWTGSKNINQINMIKRIENSKINDLPWNELIWLYNTKDRNILLNKKQSKESFKKKPRSAWKKVDSKTIESKLKHFSNTGNGSPIAMTALACKTKNPKKWSESWINNFKSPVRIAGILTATINNHLIEARELLATQTLPERLSKVANLSLLTIFSDDYQKKTNKEKAIMTAISEKDIDVRTAAILILHILNDPRSDRLIYDTQNQLLNENYIISLTSIIYPEWLDELEKLDNIELITKSLQGRWNLDKRHLEFKRKNNLEKGNI